MSTFSHLRRRANDDSGFGVPLRTQSTRAAARGPADRSRAECILLKSFRRQSKTPGCSRADSKAPLPRCPALARTCGTPLGGSDGGLSSGGSTVGDSSADGQPRPAARRATASKRTAPVATAPPVLPLTVGTPKLVPVSPTLKSIYVCHSDARWSARCQTDGLQGAQEAEGDAPAVAGRAQLPSMPLLSAKVLTDVEGKSDSANGVNGTSYSETSTRATEGGGAAADQRATTPNTAGTRRSWRAMRRRRSSMSCVPSAARRRHVVRFAANTVFVHGRKVARRY
ncbi:hypothetical protein STCU_10249 [Strigomonas culicis]|uniref:Uncharacterized protein n=1 Tax=Strigomonas culicis TaxID=28005 RepID=S9UTZ7_9TRYP|nr:hypothetical protein STCU_10249 [Strigomonas culicis]|eukprot:EPY18016.1 hypothetical protein STCU_10249 [Strigomonas culicis]